ncbi:MAG: TMEM175 family protein [Sphingomicrobium sp.]
MRSKRRTRAVATDHPNHPPHTPAHPLERLIFFSDAVFAIAITLLIIEIHPPHLERGTPVHDQLVALSQLLPHFVGFFISFGVIGAFWVGHHRAFSFARHWSPRLVLPNLLLLCAIAFMPFATSYMNANMWQVVPTAFYASVLLTTSLLNIWLVHRATAPEVVDEAADRRLIVRTRSRGWGVATGAALSLLIAFIDPIWSQPALATIPLWLRMYLRLADRRFERSQ